MCITNVDNDTETRFNDVAACGIVTNVAVVFPAELCV